MKIKRVYVRHYRDNRQTTAYVDWENGSRTEGPAYMWWPSGDSSHMQLLFARAQRDGLTVERETW